MKRFEAWLVSSCERVFPGTRELVDPFTVQDGDAFSSGWAYGDPFVVYPGPSGPLDSIRWEVFAEALNDYRLLDGAGVTRDDPLLAPLKNFARFPKDPGWRAAARAAVFRRMGRKEKRHV